MELTTAADTSRDENTKPWTSSRPSLTRFVKKSWRTRLSSGISKRVVGGAAEGVGEEEEGGRGGWGWDLGVSLVGM